jgi:hypothetical protein
MAPRLDELPLELVDRIVDYLPHRDALLQLRLTCRELCAKTLDQFSKAYFSISTWTLGASNAKAISHFSTRPKVVSHLTCVTLKAPTKIRIYDNFWRAKGINPTELANALTQFTQLRTLRLIDFGYSNGIKDSWSFFRLFVSNLSVPNLRSLQLTRVDIEKEDAIKLMRQFKDTIEVVVFEAVNLLYRSDTNEKRPEYYSPWSDALLAMKDTKNECQVTIEEPKENGSTASLGPTWDDWYGEYEYKGLTIEYVPDDPDVEYNHYEEIEEHLYIHIDGNSDWWKGVERICAFYLVRIIPSIEEEEDEYGEPIWMYEEPSDMYWDKKLEELLVVKNKEKEAASQVSTQNNAGGAAETGKSS